MNKKLKPTQEALTQSPGDSDGISSQDSFSPRKKTEIEKKRNSQTENSELPASGMRSPGLLRDKQKDISHL